MGSVLSSFSDLYAHINISIPNSSSTVSFSSGVVPGHVNEILLEATQIQGSGIISIEEVINGVDVILSQVQVQPGQQVTQLIPVVPSTTSVKIKFKYLGVSWKWYGKKICVKVPQMQSETYLVDVCDEVGDKYRFGYSGQEKINEWAGIGNFMEFSERGQDTRIGRFLSVDPIARQYPWNSPYAFAENSPISGIDLEGLEYMNANQAKIEMINGILKIKLQNLSNPSKNAIGNNNPKNWKPGEIGVNTTIGKIVFNLSNPQEGAVNKMTSLDNSIGAPDPTNTTNPINYKRTPPTAKSTGQPDRRYKTNYSANTMTPGVGSAKGAGIFSIAVNTLNWGLEAGLNWKINQDIKDINYQVGRYAPLIQEDLTKAINRGMIPDKYLNSTDLSNIGNVILQGVNNTDNADIYNIGMDIYNNISKDNEIKIEYRESGLDNFPSQPIIIQPLQTD